MDRIVGPLPVRGNGPFLEEREEASELSERGGQHPACRRHEIGEHRSFLAPPSMPYTFSIDGRIVHFAWSGVVAKEDLQSIGKEMPRLARELGFAPNVLHTFDAVTGHSFQPLAVYMHSLLRKRVVIPTPVRSAAVTKTSEGASLARMFVSLNRSPNLEMKVFDSEEVARRWLGAS